MTDKEQSGKLIPKIGQTGGPIGTKGSKKKSPAEPAPHQTRIDWTSVEAAMLNVFKAHSWTAERHRVNPAHTVSIVIKHVVPKVISELLD